MRDAIAQEALPAGLHGRLQIKWTGAVCPGGFCLGSPYLVSGIGVKAKRNEEFLHMIAAVLSTLNGKWILAGDFNCTPEQLADTGWLR